MTMVMRSLSRNGAIAICAIAALAMMSGSASARWGGCWGCGAFAAGAIAGAALAAPYNPPRYYYSAPVVVAPPPVVVTPAPAPIVVTTPYPVCPPYGPMPYYCR
jgi:hypothetical protein